VWNVGLWLEPHRAVAQPNDVLAHMNSLAASHSHIKVPIMPKFFFRSSNSTFHLKNFCEKIFQLE